MIEVTYSPVSAREWPSNKCNPYSHLFTCKGDHSFVDADRCVCGKVTYAEENAKPKITYPLFSWTEISIV